jgi:hypothetical protein
VLAYELRRLGPTLNPALLKDRGHVGVGHEGLKPLLVPSKTTQTRRSSFGSRKTCEPLLPCCFRFSAPLVENAFQNRPKSPTFAVDKTMILLPLKAADEY